MSNHNRPRFSLPGNRPAAPPPPLAPPPPPITAPPTDTFAALIERYPLPWCVGPDGYLWVAADVEKVPPERKNELGVTPDGWKATGSRARLVLEHKLPADFAAAILSVVNRHGKG